MNNFTQTSFNIRFINKNKNSHTGNRSFSSKKIGNYLEQNKTQIYFRPELPCYILLDLDNNPSTSTLAKIAKAKAFLILQTSETRYHAWFYDPTIKDWEAYEFRAKQLAKRFNGDMLATNKKQVGRLPNYKNHKRGGYKSNIYYSSNHRGILKPINIIIENPIVDTRPEGG